MTHDSPAREGFRFPPRRPRSLEGLPDIDDLVRQLSDFIDYPVLCRNRACRLSERCQGGYGPPCFDADREVFAEHMRNGLREMRRFWKRQRALAAQRDAEASSGTGGS
jgi:hypothetical protein